MIVGMSASLWDSVATFRQSTLEKVSFVLLCQVDLALTILALNFGLAELNPFIRYLVNVPALLLVVKCVIPLLIAWLIPGKLLLPSIVLLSGALVWNIKELIVFLM